MVKQRMASVDVAGEISCLKQKVVGLRLANIYDLNAKTYVLKLAKSGSDGEKVFLLLESGTRFHTVQVMYDKPDAPSNFTLKLRKHLRTRRLEDVRQLGVDRVVDFIFGSGDNAHHLILEMYAQGNVILADSTYQVLTLLRSHRDDDKGLSFMAKHPYPMHAIRLRQPLLLETLKQVLAGARDSPAPALLQVNGDPPQNDSRKAAGAASKASSLIDHAEEQTGAATGSNRFPTATAGSSKRGKKGPKDSEPVLKSVISELVPYGPAVAEHCCVTAGLHPQHPLAQQPLTEDQVQAVFAAVQQFEAWLASLDQGAVAEGYIAALPAAGNKQQSQQGEDSRSALIQPAGQNDATCQQQQHQRKDGLQKELGAGLVFQDYNPLNMAQLSKAAEVLTFTTFDEALDEFYSKIQGQRMELAKLDAERAALCRLDKIRFDQGSRAIALEHEAAASELRASLIEYNLEAVDAAIDAVNAAIATGMDWHDLELLIKEERQAGNPVAGSIYSLQLDQNKITLLLSNLLDEEEEDEAALTRPATKVQVELGLTAYSNAAAHHAARKKQLGKQEKTMAAHAEALKAAEKKAEKQLANLRSSATTAQVVRKAAWFERFHWFISSENYLIISGRDAQQNELIVKKYFRKDDIYVHAELHGASSTIVRNHDPLRPVPALTLQQAGCACVCRSRAWDSKVVTSAWWVYHSQVSKTAPTGEYLPSGSFMVRGKKNFLPPQGLLMGFGFMFKLEDSFIGRHAGERAVRGLLDEQQQQPQPSGSDDENQDSLLGSFLSEAAGLPPPLTAASSSSTSALDSFLDMSADQLAAAAAAARTTGSSTNSQACGTGGATAASFKRYGLSHPAAADAIDLEDEQQQQQQDDSSKMQPDSKRYITAAERARLKKAAKGRSIKQPQQQSKQEQQQQDKPASSAKPPLGPADAVAAAAAKSQRGKKSKAAKVKEKYLEQDEADRELALKLLGSAGAHKTRHDRRRQRKAAREEFRPATSGAAAARGEQQEAIRRATGSQFTDLVVATAAHEQGSATSGSDGGKRLEAETTHSSTVAAVEAGSDTDQDTFDPEVAATAAVIAAAASTKGVPESRSAENGDATAAVVAADRSDDDEAAVAAAAATDEAECAEISALLAEENVAEMPYCDGDAAAAALRELDSLTGCPRPDDVLLYAVPVCGPYAALANYKYKVKLTPGTLKKGKAVKQAVDVLLKGQDVIEWERELMRACPDADMVNAMVGTVKISAAGLQQIKQASKKARKAAAQSRAGGKIW